MRRGLQSWGVVSLALLLAACATGESDKQRELHLLLDKGRAYLERGNAPMALHSLQQAERLQPQQVEVLTLLGLAYDRTDQPLLALSSLEEAYRLQPGGGALRNNLGVARLRVYTATCGDALREECSRLLRLAEEDMRAALHDPQLRAAEEVYYNLALLYKQRGQQSEQWTALQQALAHRPHFLPAYLELADYYREAGQRERERQQLRTALAAHPDQVVVLQKLVESYRWSEGSAGQLLDEVTGKERLELHAWLSRILALAPGSAWAQRAAQRIWLLDEK
ncbi:MAG: hypothetical protein HQM06_08710 [Magnetococcales bacterium]|nr:hypothetical protein [Magnetococcales bacterium]